MLTVRVETPRDLLAIHAVHVAAFAGEVEADIVDALRAAGGLVVSLVAEIDDQVIGHIAFSRVILNGAVGGWGLGPVAVVPTHQRQGIGKRLVIAGLQAATREGATFVVVVGDPTYYAQFGFKAAQTWELRDEFDTGPAFQALELTPGAIPPRGGLVRYASHFSQTK